MDGESELLQRRQLQMTDQRVTELEIQLAHLQRQYDQLNEVVTEQAATVDRLRNAIQKMQSSVQDLQSKQPDERNPESEKPPHY